jgi:hypothetical protein
MSQVINDATSSLLVLRIEQKEKETEEFLYLQTNKPKKKKKPNKTWRQVWDREIQQSLHSSEKNSSSTERAKGHWWQEMPAKILTLRAKG